MHILKIVIDGFKSYPERIEIGPFDHHFNAITGFNGSGKSNILDAICFVLGTNSWAQMRANNPLELIYKQGTAGVVKASVSITFDNHDKSRSPMQYVDQDEITVTRQVTAGGRTIKYKINGRTMQVSDVQNMFHSVQLNINNPHFLIMQGHITKVLNMKPKEILGLLEEASGTRMFETKKASVRKRIEGHDGKVEDIDKTLKETIDPTLQRLSEDKLHYMRYLDLKNQVSEQQRILVAHKYVLAQQQVQQLSEKKQGPLDEPDIQSVLQERKNELDEIQIMLNQLRKEQQDSVDIQQSEVNKNQAALRLKSKELECKRLSEDMIKETENVKLLQEQLDELDREKKRKQDKLQNQIEKLNIAEESQLTTKASLAGIGQNNTLLMGAEKTTLEDQVMKIQLQISDLETELFKLEREISDTRSKVEHATKLIQRDSDGDGFSQQANTFYQLKSQYEASKSEMDQIQKDIQRTLSDTPEQSKIIEFEEKCWERLVQAKEVDGLSSFQLKHDDKSNMSPTTLYGAHMNSLPIQERLSISIQAVEMMIESLNSKDRPPPLSEQESNLLKAVQFDYGHVNQLNQERVYGQVCDLIKVKDEGMAAALTIAGGARWHHVVVQSSAEAMLLTKAVNRRTTFIMLDDIQTRKPDLSILEKARRAVGDNAAWFAQSLVEVPEYLKPAVSYVLGDTLICQNGSAARTISFELKLARAVSLQGDVYDVHGTLTGGEETEKKVPLLQVLHKIKDRHQHIQAWGQRLQKLNHYLVKMKDLFKKWMLAKNQYDCIELRLNSTEDPELILGNYSKRLAELMENKQATLDSKTRAEILSSKFKTASTSRQDPNDDSNLKASQQLQLDLVKATEEIKKCQEAKVRLKAEMNEIENDIAGIRSTMDEANANLVTLNTSFVCTDRERLILANQHQELVQQYEVIVDKMKLRDEHIAKLNSKNDACHAAIREYTMKSKVQEVQNERNKLLLQKAQETVNELRKRHPGLEHEAKCYDTKTEQELMSIVVAQSNGLKDSEDELKRLQHMVNPKAAQLSDQFQRECDLLRKKMNIIQDDRQAIEETIKEFDQRKLSTIKQAFETVSKDFRDIFRSLTHGLDTMLEQVSDDISQGLNIRFKLANRVANLNELSGGQRSLLALSLLLALLKYNPAPMYILDEVDSALDNSNTQNIGIIFKEKFPQSQFIVVSLKQDLLASSNVLFTARYDTKSGSSAVIRTTPGADKLARNKTTN